VGWFRQYVDPLTFHKARPVALAAFRQDNRAGHNSFADFLFHRIQAACDKPMILPAARAAA
jgi:hypothetical protein